MTSLLGNISSIRKKLIRERFIRELTECKINSSSLEEEPNWNDERIKALETIINIYSEEITNLESQNTKSLTDDLNEANNLIYKKAWNRLPDFHKSIKIKEYIESIISDKQKQKEIIKNLSQLLNQHKLTSPSTITYDSINTKILGISVLIHNDETNQFELQLNLTFKTSWENLHDYHKISKIKDYIRNTIKDSQAQDDIIEKLTTSLDELKHPDDITYDPSTGTIKSIKLETVKT